ncbi:MAG TPA: hypothetical protein PKB14_03800 [Rubrivivax sp.]|nr:hypothetical protein [Rubrivivax sp.]
MDLPRCLRIQAHANALSTQRLGAALPDAARPAPRTGFFSSLARIDAWGELPRLAGIRSLGWDEAGVYGAAA